MRDAGWQIASDVDWRGLLLWLSPQVALHELPVLPQIHDGRVDVLRLVRYDDPATTRWVVRFWDVDARLREGLDGVGADER